jgi:tRNA(Ile)-lysidine synthase
MDLLRNFLNDLSRLACLPHLAGQRVVVAVSGGADSLCLLHLLHRAAGDLRMDLFVATLDHGLRGSAGADDAAFVADIAHQWGLPVAIGKVSVPALARQYGLGIEETARRARYSFLASTALRNSAHAIAVGHQADDQAETVLMHLIRGSGLAGLRGMQPVTPLTAQHLLPGEALPPGIVLVRPLLACSRATIESYCASEGLEARQDATNADRTYVRNRIRHEVLPVLEALNPEIRASLVRTGLSLSDDYTKLDRLAQVALDHATQAHTPERLSLDLERFRGAEPSLQRRVLRRAVQELAPRLGEPGFETLAAALAIAREGSPGQQATLPGAIRLLVGHTTLDITLPEEASPPHPEGPWLPPGTLQAVTLPGSTVLAGSGWRLVARWLAPDEDPAAFHRQPLSATLALPAGATLALRTRQPGDRFAPLGMGNHSQKLKDVLINARVPAVERDRLPLLMVNREIAWILAPDRNRIAQPFAIRQDSPCRALFICERDSTPSSI